MWTAARAKVTLYIDRLLWSLRPVPDQGKSTIGRDIHTYRGLASLGQ
jgi:hypothetical protein